MQLLSNGNAVRFSMCLLGVVIEALHGGLDGG